MPALQLRPRCKRTQPELDLVPPTHLQVLFYSQELVTLPAGTLQVKNDSVCASVRGMPFSPCFNLTKLDEKSFRGAVSGFGFASCEFTRQNGRAAVIRSTHNEPLRLRPSITANASAN